MLPFTPKVHYFPIGSAVLITERNESLSNCPSIKASTLTLLLAISGLTNLILHIYCFNQPIYPEVTSIGIVKTTSAGTIPGIFPRYQTSAYVIHRRASSAFGVAFRAAGSGFRVLVIQYIKGKWKTGLDAPDTDRSQRTAGGDRGRRHRDRDEDGETRLQPGYQGPAGGGVLAPAVLLLPGGRALLNSEQVLNPGDSAPATRIYTPCLNRQVPPADPYRADVYSDHQLQSAARRKDALTTWSG